MVEQHRRDAQFLDDLSLLEVSSEDEDETGPSAAGTHPTFGTALPPLEQQAQSSKSQRRKQDKFQIFANMLAWGASLSSLEQLPEDLVASTSNDGFLAKPLPQGKRCLVLSYAAVSKRRNVSSEVSVCSLAW